MPDKDKFHWKGFLPENSPVKPAEDTIPEMIEWFSGTLGKELLADEQQQLNEALQCLFGYFLLELGVDPAFGASASSRISHCFSLHPLVDTVTQKPSAQADFHHLPLPDKAIDVAVLHHVLDFSPNPHQLLRESARLIIPRGHLVIIGFNPRSFMGQTRWVMQFFSKRSIWQRQSLHLDRVLDWLKLLDFEPVSIESGFFRPPVHSPGMLKHLHWLERWGKKLRLLTGSYYLIVARKDIAGVTPLLKPAWKKYSAVGVTPSVIRIISRCEKPSMLPAVYRRVFKPGCPRE